MSRFDFITERIRRHESLQKTFETSVRKSLEAYAIATSTLYQAESFIGPAIDLIVNRRRPRLPFDDEALFKAAHRETIQLLKKDVARITSGVYPIDVLKPENPIRHLLRMPKMFAEGVAIVKRRNKQESRQFSDEARELMTGLPEYYQRNFHFQGDGYLSERSAELYDHQVNVLFVGAAHAMRRLIIEPMKQHFGSMEGEGLTFLELGAGSGSSTLFVRLAFPKAKIVSVDLAAPYLKLAQLRLGKFPRHDFLESDAAHLPFKDEMFDAVFSVFLFHELPQKERMKVLHESQRVLKPNGFHGLVDSLQLGDQPLFDVALDQFPREFHEPFYKNYAQHPMPVLLSDAGVKDIKSELGGFAKVVFGHK